MHKKLLFWLAGFWLISLLQGCGQAPSVVASSATVRSATPGTGASPLVGIYRTTLFMAPGSRVLLPSDLEYETWNLELSENGRFTLRYFDKPWFEGDYSINNSQFKF